LAAVSSAARRSMLWLSSFLLWMVLAPPEAGGSAAAAADGGDEGLLEFGLSACSCCNSRRWAVPCKGGVLLRASAASSMPQVFAQRNLSSCKHQQQQ
jgi:hypothetical protein